MSRVAFLFALSRFGLSPIGLEPDELAGDRANAGANTDRGRQHYADHCQAVRFDTDQCAWRSTEGSRTGTRTMLDRVVDTWPLEKWTGYIKHRR